MGFLIFLLTVASLAIIIAILFGWYCLCKEFKEIAESKGYDGKNILDIAWYLALPE